MTEPKNEESKMGCPEDAEERFQKWKDQDPFPEISPALLNSADIHDYIKTTGMVDPYDPSLMKSSSYEAKIGSYAYRWGEGKERETVPLDKDLFVNLEPNSLVFFETKETFRLPSYIAIRFNLRITNVHRGLLLGTGPLVDPGFEGKLLIPIHNLTNNPYRFYGDDPFIWIEFTKISHNEIWNQELQEKTRRRGVYKRFPEDKLDLSPNDYFKKANNGNRIQNAIPEVLSIAKKQADNTSKKVNIITYSGIVAAVSVVAAILLGVSPIITDSVDLSKDISKTISEFRKEYQGHLANEVSSETKIEAFDGKIADIKLGDQMRDKLSGQQRQLNALQEQFGALRTELNRYKALLSEPNPPPQKSE